MDVMSLADRSWPILRRLMGVHAQIYRLTNGMVGHRFPGAPPVLLLDHVGAKSGIKRTTPLVYVPDDRTDGVRVVGLKAHGQLVRSNDDFTLRLSVDVEDSSPEREATHWDES